MSDTTKLKRRLKVLLVEDHPMFREHLGQLINRDLGMTVCGEADNIKDAMRLVLETKPDIAIVDITLRGSLGSRVFSSRAARLKRAGIPEGSQGAGVDAERSRSLHA